MVVTNKRTGKTYRGKFVCFQDDQVEGLGKVIDFGGQKRFFANHSREWRIELGAT